MAAAIGYELKAVRSKDGNEFGGGDSFGHGLRIRSSDSEFSYGDFTDLWDGGRFREVFEIELKSFLEVVDGLLFGGTETGHVVIEALGDVVGFFAVEGVVDVSHQVKIREKLPDCKFEGF